MRKRFKIRLREEKTVIYREVYKKRLLLYPE